MELDHVSPFSPEGVKITRLVTLSRAAGGLVVFRTKPWDFDRDPYEERTLFLFSPESESEDVIAELEAFLFPRIASLYDVLASNDCRNTPE